MRLDEHAGTNAQKKCPLCTTESMQSRCRCLAGPLKQVANHPPPHFSSLCLFHGEPRHYIEDCQPCDSRRADALWRRLVPHVGVARQKVSWGSPWGKFACIFASHHTVICFSRKDGSFMERKGLTGMHDLYPGFWHFDGAPLASVAPSASAVRGRSARNRRQNHPGGCETTNRVTKCTPIHNGLLFYGTRP